MTYYLAPSLICADLLNLGSSLEAVQSSGVGMLHLDVMDSVLVRGFGFSAPLVAAIRAKTSLFLDLHLMTEHSSYLIDEYINAGVDRLIVHAESKDFHQAMDRALSMKKRVGVGLMFNTDFKVLDPYLPYIETVLVFTVKAGWRGQQILPEAPQRVMQIASHVHARNVECSIQVDGGIYDHSIHELASCGASTFVVGSAFFGSGNFDGQMLNNRRATLLKLARGADCA